MPLLTARNTMSVVLLASALVLACGPAQGDPATRVDDPVVAPADDDLLSGSARSTRTRLPRAVSDWDLYTGSVYANTSPVWVQAEYLLWWLRGNQVPPLATTSLPGTPRDEAGVLGAPGTELLFGSERVDDQARGGFRTALGVRLGHWFDALMDCELQGDYLWVGDGQSSGDFEADSRTTVILARPFVNAELGLPDALLVAYPDVAAGALGLETSSDFQAAGAAVRRGWLSGDLGRIEWLAGYRYMRLRETLLAHSTTIVTEAHGPVPAGTLFDMSDRFETWNEFHGGDVGLQWWTQAHGWTLEILTKVSLGGLSRIVSINGETVTQTPADDMVWQPGGLLAQPSNIGRRRSTCFTAAPELSLKLRRQVTRHLIFTVGYSLLAVDRVARTGDQLDLAVNPSQFHGGALIGPPRPAAWMNDSTLWLHGLTLGLEW